MNRCIKSLCSKVALLAAVLLIMWGVGLFGRRLPFVRSAGPSASIDPERVLDTIAARNSDAIERLREASSTWRLPSEGDQASSESSAPQAVRGHKLETIRSFRKAAWIAHEARRMFNRTALQEKEFERVVNDPAALALAVAVATDLEAAKEIYGKEQALMRTYAVGSVSYAAAHGHPEIAVNAVDVLGKKLNESEHWEKGIERDYVDLTASYIRTLGRQTLLADPESVWRRIHLTERTSVEVGRALYDSGVLGDIGTQDRQVLSSSYDGYIASLER